MRNAGMVVAMAMMELWDRLECVGDAGAGGEGLGAGEEGLAAGEEGLAAGVGVVVLLGLGWNSSWTPGDVQLEGYLVELKGRQKGDSGAQRMRLTLGCNSSEWPVGPYTVLPWMHRSFSIATWSYRKRLLPVSKDLRFH